MIWMYSNNKIKGYVPTLKKEYTEEEIRSMSFFLNNGWSKLSRLIMEIQGIKYSQFTIDKHYKVEVKKLVDITTDFNFEICWLPENDQREKYLKFIVDFLLNLTLTKIVEYSETQINGILKYSTKKLKYLVAPETLNDISSDLKNIVLTSQNTTYYLKKFTTHYNLSNIFSYSEKNTDQFFKERVAKADFKLLF